MKHLQTAVVPHHRFHQTLQTQLVLLVDLLLAVAVRVPATAAVLPAAAAALDRAASLAARSAAAMVARLMRLQVPG